MDQTVRKAIIIAKSNLRSCYTKKGILTGSRGVYWSWDSFYASFGSLALGDTDIAKQNLELYLSFQNKSGNIPKRIANPLYPLRYIGLPISENDDKQKPSFSSPYFTGVSISQCPVLIISFWQYIQKSNDLDFLKKYYGRLDNIFNFLSSHRYKRSGLLKESIGGGWAESVLKRGAIAYTNICYARSLVCMAELAKRFGQAKASQKYTDLSVQTIHALNTYLWHNSRGGYFSDWLGISRHHYFVSDANLLAILWGIASPNQARNIEKSLDKLLLNNSTPIPLTLDKYYIWRIFFTNIMGGIKDYHVGFSWIWLGCIASLAKQKLGKDREAKAIIKKISSIIVKNNGVFEIYKGTKPVHTPLYKSENPWAWSAGVFLFACDELGFDLSDL